MSSDLDFGSDFVSWTKQWFQTAVLFILVLWRVVLAVCVRSVDCDRHPHGNDIDTTIPSNKGAEGAVNMKGP